MVLIFAMSNFIIKFHYQMELFFIVIQTLISNQASSFCVKKYQMKAIPVTKCVTRKVDNEFPEVTQGILISVVC